MGYNNYSLRINGNYCDFFDNKANWDNLYFPFFFRIYIRNFLKKKLYLNDNNLFVYLYLNFFFFLYEFYSHYYI